MTAAVASSTRPLHVVPTFGRASDVTFTVSFDGLEELSEEQMGAIMASIWGIQSVNHVARQAGGLKISYSGMNKRNMTIRLKEALNPYHVAVQSGRRGHRR